MTTVEFVTKCLNKAKINLEIQKQRKGVSQKEVASLEEKVKHYQDVLRMYTELETTRAYLHDNGLEWDLLSYSKRKGGNNA